MVSMVTGEDGSAGAPRRISRNLSIADRRAACPLCKEMGRNFISGTTVLQKSSPVAALGVAVSLSIMT